MARRPSKGNPNPPTLSRADLQLVQEREMEELAFKAGILPPPIGNAAMQTRVIRNDMPARGGGNPGDVVVGGDPPGEKKLSKLFTANGKTSIFLGSAKHYKNIKEFDDAHRGLGDMVIGVDLPWTGISRGRGWTAIELNYHTKSFASIICSCACVRECDDTFSQNNPYSDGILGDLKNALAEERDDGHWFTRTSIQKCCGIECHGWYITEYGEEASWIITVSTAATGLTESKDGAVLYFQGAPSAENIAAAEKQLRADLNKKMSSPVVDLANELIAIQCSPFCDRVQ